MLKCEKYSQRNPVEPCGKYSLPIYRQLCWPGAKTPQMGRFAKTPQIGRFPNGIVQNSHNECHPPSEPYFVPSGQMGFDPNITIAREPRRPLKLSSLESEKMTTGFLCMKIILLHCMKAGAAAQASVASSGRQPLIMSDMCSFLLHICFTS